MDYMETKSNSKETRYGIYGNQIKLTKETRYDIYGNQSRNYGKQNESRNYGNKTNLTRFFFFVYIFFLFSDFFLRTQTNLNNKRHKG